jgi:hypothetical protein
VPWGGLDRMDVLDNCGSNQGHRHDSGEKGK